MSQRMNFAALAVVVVVVLAASLLQNTTAVTYEVGDNLGWLVPPGGAVAYSTWASLYNFTVGDILVFNFTTGQHDVARVTKEGFDACNATNPISLETVGPANFTLNATGKDYFICTFGQHCVLGQKLSINITSTSGAPPPASPPTSPSPAPSPTATPPPPPSISPPPPPSISPSPHSSHSPAPSPNSTPPPPGTVSPPPPPPTSTSPQSSPPPSTTPSGTDVTPPPPPPPPPPSSAQLPTAVTTFSVIFMSIAVGVLC